MTDLVSRVPRSAAYPSDTIREIATHYMRFAEMFGLRCDVLWAQALLETNGFRFGGQVLPSAWNFCGLREKDGSGFYTFYTPLYGVRAHVAHLAMHVFPDHVNAFCSVQSDPKHGPHYRDKSRVGDLGKGPYAWAPNPEYGANLCRVWEKGL